LQGLAPLAVTDDREAGVRSGRSHPRRCLQETVDVLDRDEAADDPDEGVALPRRAGCAQPAARLRAREPGKVEAEGDDADLGARRPSHFGEVVAERAGDGDSDV